MNKAIREIATTVTTVASAVTSVIVAKWFFDTFIKKDKSEEKETEENDEA